MSAIEMLIGMRFEMTIERHNKLKALAGVSLCWLQRHSSTRDVDLTGELHSPAFEPLADPDYFVQVRVDDEWARQDSNLGPTDYESAALTN
jgi:hypothetical protein